MSVFYWFFFMGFCLGLLYGVIVRIFKSQRYTVYSGMFVATIIGFGYPLMFNIAWNLQEYIVITTPLVFLAITGVLLGSGL